MTFPVAFPFVFPRAAAGAHAISNLTDDFTTRDDAKWHYDGNPGSGTTAVVSGQLQITPTFPGGWQFIYANNSNYDLRNSALLVEVVQVGSYVSGSDSSATWMYTQSATDNSNYVGFYANKSSIHFIDYLAANPETTPSIPYDPVLHRWWRLRASETTLYWETSSNGGAWILHRQKPMGRDYSTENPVLYAEYYDADGSDTLSIFDNFNVSPVVASDPGTPTDQLKAAGTLNGLSGLSNVVVDRYLDKWVHPDITLKPVGPDPIVNPATALAYLKRKAGRG